MLTHEQRVNVILVDVLISCTKNSLQKSIPNARRKRLHTCFFTPYCVSTSIMATKYISLRSIKKNKKKPLKVCNRKQINKPSKL